MFFLLAVLALAVLSGATAAVIGFGIGSVLTPLLLTRFEPHVAISVVALPHLIATATRYVQHRQWIDRTVLLRFGLPSAIGGFVGAVAQDRFQGSTLVVVLAVLLISTGIANFTRGFGGWHPRSMMAIVLGSIAGIFGGLVGNQGGFRSAGLTAFALEPRPYLATGTAVGLLIDLARTPVYLARSGPGLVDLALPIVIATAGCFAGTIAGERMFLRMSPQRYRKVVGMAVLILGVWLLASQVL